MKRMIIFNNDAAGSLEFTVTWEQDGITHEEWFLGRRINPVNDIYPRGMREALEGKAAGDSVTFTYETRMCIPRHKESQVRKLTIDRLRKKTVHGKPIIPRLGRFYPQGHINRLTDIYPDTLTPFRLIELGDDTFTADCNHPLALIPVTMTARIQDLTKRATGTYGPLNHWRENTCDWGPGMQTRYNGQSTDFFLPGFFDRTDNSDTPFTPPPVDAKALSNLKQAYARFLKPNMRIYTTSMDAQTPPSGEYDAAICTLGIEYQANPVEFLKTIRDHLKPGGTMLIGFTDHYDASRAIEGWINMHDFERMGLVLEYLRQAGLDHNAGTISIRNDWREQDDPLFLNKRGVSDPVFVVHGQRS